MYTVLHGDASLYLADNLMYCAKVHNRNLRSSSNGLLYVPFSKTVIGKKAFRCVGATTWNGIPKDIRECSSVHYFKCQYKGHLLKS